MGKEYHTYIATNKNNTVLYTGVTADISRRIFEHKNKCSTESFTSRYNIDKLVWCEAFNTPQEAILAEKKIKGWTRKKKIALIKSQNPKFKNLFED